MKLLSFTVVLAMASSVMAGDGVHRVETQDIQDKSPVSKVYAPCLSNNKAFDDLGGVKAFDLGGVLQYDPSVRVLNQLDRDYFFPTDTGAGTLALAGALLSCGVQPQLIAHTLYAGAGGLDPKVFEDLCRPSFQSFNVTVGATELYTIKKKPWWKRLLCCC